MLTASTSTPYMRDVARALLQPGIRIMAARIVGEHASLDAISIVAERMAKRERAGKPVPAKLEHYVCKAVQRECFRIYNSAKAHAIVDIDEVALPVEPEPAPAAIGLPLDQLTPMQAEQIRLTYWAEIPVRASERGVPFGTAVSATFNGKAALRKIEETHAAAYALGIGRVAFEPVDTLAWARERARLSRTCSGLQTLELIEVWTALALREGTDLESVEDWAMRIVGASTEQMDVAEVLIGEHWAPLRASADVRGAA